MAQRLTTRTLSFKYSASEPNALSSLSIEVESGTCCAILGPTGSGKSSLLHCLAGSMRRHHPGSIASGQVQIGETVFPGIPGYILFPITGLVLQDPYVQISGVRDTVYDEILFTLENLGTTPHNPRESIESVLRELGIGGLAGRKPTSLSGGETQRVALAAIMVAQPDVLLLDEPTTALDSGAQERLARILRSLHGSTTVLLTDTQVDFALAVADQVIVLDHGSIVFRGDSESLLSELHNLSSLLPVEGWIAARRNLDRADHRLSHRGMVLKALGLR